MVSTHVLQMVMQPHRPCLDTGLQCHGCILAGEGIGADTFFVIDNLSVQTELFVTGHGQTTAKRQRNEIAATLLLKLSAESVVVRESDKSNVVECEGMLVLCVDLLCAESTRVHAVSLHGRCTAPDNDQLQGSHERVGHRYVTGAWTCEGGCDRMLASPIAWMIP